MPTTQNQKKHQSDSTTKGQQTSVRDKSKLSDAGAERGVIASIIKYGKNTLIDVSGVISAADFSWTINRAIFLALQKLDQDQSIKVFDTETIKATASSIGFAELFKDKRGQDYVELLKVSAFPQENVMTFANVIKKWSIIRQLFDRFDDGQKYLLDLNGEEMLGEVVSKCEGVVLDYLSGTEEFNQLMPITSDIDEHLKQLLDAEPVTQIGIPTGFPIWDDLIGGGVRRGTVNMIAARPKTGKSFVAMNMAYNIAKLYKIPTLYLDTELTRQYQQSRMISIAAECPIHLYETGQFKHNKELVSKLKTTVGDLKDLPFVYESVAGRSSIEILSIVRRWITKFVGFYEDGKAKECVIVFDYLKLMSGDKLSGHTPEYILLGLMMTELHNFAVKYGVPFIVFGQTNRDGIDGSDTNIIAGSDRLLWLCSNMSVLKNKDENDIALNCGFVHGNKKLTILETRHGSGFTMQGDYINIRACLKPGFDKTVATGKITEGLLLSNLRTSGDLSPPNADTQTENTTDQN